jgi:integrase
VAAAFEFCILSASRAGEVLGATWREIDRRKGLWILSASRMKARRPHTSPTTIRMCEILDMVAPLRAGPGSLVFPGNAKGPISSKAFERVLDVMGYKTATAHGTARSGFRDWVGDFGHSREVAEAQLAHAVGDATERAYRRGEAIELRRELLNEWERFLVGGSKKRKIAACKGKEDA